MFPPYTIGLGNTMNSWNTDMSNCSLCHSRAHKPMTCVAWLGLVNSNNIRSWLSQGNFFLWNFLNAFDHVCSIRERLLLYEQSCTGVLDVNIMHSECICLMYAISHCSPSAMYDVNHLSLHVITSLLLSYLLKLLFIFVQTVSGGFHVIIMICTPFSSFVPVLIHNSLVSALLMCLNLMSAIRCKISIFEKL